MAAFPPNIPSPSPSGDMGAPQAPVSPQLADKGSPLSGSLLQMILAFLAGNGIGPLISNLQKLSGKGGPGAKAKGGQTTRPGQPPQGQIPPGSPPQPVPGQQIPPEILLQLLAAKGQQ